MQFAPRIQKQTRRWESPDETQSRALYSSSSKLSQQCLLQDHVPRQDGLPLFVDIVRFDSIGNGNGDGFILVFGVGQQILGRNPGYQVDIYNDARSPLFEVP